MQKKLIALAVAGLMSAPVFAQSNVTIYGIVDMGYKNLGDHVTDGVGNKNAFDSGQYSGSRLGFKGTEDLGNGLKALFVLEQGINADLGSSAQGGLTFGRQSFVGLSGGFGTVAMGRQYTPQHVLMSAIDPFGNGTAGEIANIWNPTTGGSVVDYPTRLNNLAAYISPSFGGFNVVAAWTWAATAQESLGNDNDVRVWAIAPTYKNGPILVGLNYHNARVISSTDKDTDIHVWDLGGSYDFGVVKLAAAIGVDDPDAGDKVKKAMLGVTVPVGPSGKVLASYSRARHELNDDEASQWAVGYEHGLSKRTVIYTAFSKINNDNDADITASVGDATNANDGYQRGFNLGIRHTF